MSTDVDSPSPGNRVLRPATPPATLPAPNPQARPATPPTPASQGTPASPPATPASPPAHTPPLAQPEAQAPQAAEVDRRPPSVEASVRPAIRAAQPGHADSDPANVTGPDRAAVEGPDRPVGDGPDRPAVEGPDRPAASPMTKGSSGSDRPGAGFPASEGPGRRRRAPVRRSRGDSAAFRRPTSHRHPLPPSGRMLALCAWATGIGALGLAVALRGLDAILAHTGPTWYEPTLAGVGLAGVALTGAAFLSAERMRLPWVMLGLATVPVVVNLGLTIGAL